MVNVLASGGRLPNTNAPSMSVIVPTFAPFTVTDAPITGCPSSAETTTPATLEVWAVIDPKNANKQVNNNNNLLLITP